MTGISMLTRGSKIGNFISNRVKRGLTRGITAAALTAMLVAPGIGVATGVIDVGSQKQEITYRTDSHAIGYRAETLHMVGPIDRLAKADWINAAEFNRQNYNSNKSHSLPEGTKAVITQSVNEKIMDEHSGELLGFSEFADFHLVGSDGQRTLVERRVFESSHNTHDRINNKRSLIVTQEVEESIMHVVNGKIQGLPEDHDKYKVTIIGGTFLMNRDGHKLDGNMVFTPHGSFIDRETGQLPATKPYGL